MVVAVGLIAGVVIILFGFVFAAVNISSDRCYSPQHWRHSAAITVIGIGFAISFVTFVYALMQLAQQLM
jgi:Na+/H+ antiporter NhaA